MKPIAILSFHRVLSAHALEVLSAKARLLATALGHVSDAARGSQRGN